MGLIFHMKVWFLHKNETNNNGKKTLKQPMKDLCLKKSVQSRQKLSTQKYKINLMLLSVEMMKISSKPLKSQSQKYEKDDVKNRLFL